MDRQQILLKLTVEALGLPFELKSFNHRLILQKTIYLAQTAGIHLGYYYRWYLKGPYSSSLTSDAFTVVAEIHEGRDETDGWKLDPESLGRAHRVAQFLPRGSLAKRADRLELLASVHFAVTRWRLPYNDVVKAKEALSALGKDFSADDIRTALETLVEHDLFAKSPN